MTGMTKSWPIVLAVALVLAGAWVWLGPFAPAERSDGLDGARGRVVAVVDSRTLRVQLENRDQPTDVTLAGLGAWPDGRHGDLAAGEVWVGVTVELDTDAPVGAYVYTDDGRFINEQLIDQGVAPHDVTTPCRASAWFARLDRYARGARRGRWAEVLGDDAN